MKDVTDVVRAGGNVLNAKRVRDLAATTRRNGARGGERDAATEPAFRPTRLLEVSDIFAPLPPVNWLCQALDMAPGAPVLIAGYGFAGKTVAVQDLALAVATGTVAWGRFSVRKGRVLHIDFEQGSYLTRMRYQRLARARGIDPRELDGRLTYAPLPDWYLDGDTHDELARLCEKVDLLIVDSFRAACPHTDENASDARIPLDRLGRVSETTGAAPVVLHHARKPVKDAQGGARMSVRGSGALYDACGSVLVFSAEKGEPVTVAHEKARISGRLHEDFRLWIEDVEIDGVPSAGLRVSHLAAAPDSQQTHLERYGELKGRVLALVREKGTVAGGVNVLRVWLAARKDDVSAAVADLVAAGAIRRGGSHNEPTLIAVGTPAARDTDAGQPVLAGVLDDMLRTEVLVPDREAPAEPAGSEKATGTTCDSE